MHPSDAYLRLAEGPEDLLGEQISLTRRLATLFVAFVLFSGTSLFAMAAFDLDQALLGKAIASSGKSGHDDDDNSGPGGGDDDHDDDDSDSDSDSTTHKGKKKGKHDDSSSDQDRDGTTDSSHGKNATDTKSDDSHDGTTDSSKTRASDDSHSDDNHNGDSDSSHGASVSMRSHATSDSKGDRTRG